jgi:hypothetical protein
MARTYMARAKYKYIHVPLALFSLVMNPRLCRFVGVPLPPLVIAYLLERVVPGLFFLGGQLCT